MLEPPLAPMLATPTSELPQGPALARAWFEPKYDGYRALVFVTGTGTTVQSRRGHDITRAFPDIAEAAAEQLPVGSVVDGELVIWGEDGFDFGALQRRLAAGRNADRLAREQPASMILFDLLATRMLDLRSQPLLARRTALEAIPLRPPLQATPYTTELAQAQEWLEDYRRARVGIEGLVVKDAAGTYDTGRRGWLKYRIRDTYEVVVGAVTGPIDDPQELVLGHYDGAGELVVAGSTTPLDRRQRAEVAGFLEPPAGDHPWPDEIGSGRLGHWGGQPRAVTLVEPTLVVEVSADSAVTDGRWRHVTRYLRCRPDLAPEEAAPPGT